VFFQSRVLKYSLFPQKALELCSKELMQYVKKQAQHFIYLAAGDTNLG
jgi:hypothetical protein